MKKSKNVFCKARLALFASAAMILASCNLPGGAGSATTAPSSEATSVSSAEPQVNEEIYAVYALYVKNAVESGEEPMSYSDWLATIKGEKGDPGEKGDKGERSEIKDGAHRRILRLVPDESAQCAAAAHKHQIVFAVDFQALHALIFPCFILLELLSDPVAHVLAAAVLRPNPFALAEPERAAARRRIDDGHIFDDRVP